MRPLEWRARRGREFGAAFGAAKIVRTPDLVGAMRATARANRAFGPARLLEMRPTSFIVVKALEEGQQGHSQRRAGMALIDESTSAARVDGGAAAIGAVRFKA